jgi:hypothetical protein
MWMYRVSGGRAVKWNMYVQSAALNVNALWPRKHNE